jgi:hypothetical protein
MENVRKNIIVPLSFIAAIMLTIGCINLPIGYYTFLRIVVCSVAVMLIIDVAKSNVNYKLIINGLIAILFNPFIPIYLHNKTAWMIIDIIAAVWFAIQGIGMLRNSNKQRQ